MGSGRKIAPESSGMAYLEVVMPSLMVNVETGLSIQILIAASSICFPL
jgi:hypothetical protein